MSEVPSDPSWQDGCSQSVDSNEAEWIEEEIEPLEPIEKEVVEFVYNIKGEVVDVLPVTPPEPEPEV